VGLSNEFSRKVVIEPWPEGGIRVALAAEPQERLALARRFGLLELATLEARGRLERDAPSGEIRLRGELEAALAQECVVSLEPVTAHLRVPVERRYRRAAGTAAPPPQILTPDRDRDQDPDPDDDEEVELVYGRTIDLGAAIAEELALAIDPYPRAAAAATLGAAALVTEALAPYISFGEAERAEPPFAALRQLKDKRAR
jgi:uncharacterized metal-binding protein YceD (DUF177 family)